MKLYVYLLLVFILVSSVLAGKVDYYRKANGPSNSMWPYMNHQDLVIMHTVRMDEPVYVNHIYCYNPDYSLWNISQSRICHRLINISNNTVTWSFLLGRTFGPQTYYTMKGDNNTAIDPYIYRYQIQSEIVGVKRRG